MAQLGRVSGMWVGLLYAALGFADMMFSLTAFTERISEGNPLMAWFMPTGLFVPAKLLVTALVACLIAYAYPRKSVQPAIWLAVLFTAGVDVYHIWGLKVLSG